MRMNSPHMNSVTVGSVKRDGMARGDYLRTTIGHVALGLSSCRKYW